MTKNYFAIFVLVIFAVFLFYTANPGIAQDIPSVGPAPVSDSKFEQGVNNTTLLNANNRGFVYISGTSLHQFGKQFMGNVTVTNIGSPFTTAGWIGALARNTNTGTLYVNNQASPFQIWSVDTNTGVCTQVIASCTGIPHANFTGMVWDHTTNTMYGVSSSLTASQIFTINMSTGVCTPIGSASTTAGGVITLVCAPNGTLFGVCIVTDVLYRIDKTTGVFTAKGALGYDANYGQDGAFDLSDGMLYLASAGPGNILRVCDTTTGSATTVIGTYSGQPACLTVIGNMGPVITHTPLPNTQNLTGPYVVNCSIIVPGGGTISAARLFWSRNSTTITDSLNLTLGTGSNYSGNIPGNGTTATYRYYLKAYDNLGRIGYQPGMGMYNTFYAIGSDTSKPVITHTPIVECPLANWPPTVSCSATDLFGIDSVWVTWRIGTGSYNRFNLARGTGDTWSGAFGTTPPVAVGNTINYRIVARDASTQHNIDSTTQYSFPIISLVTACLGTGTVAMGSASGPYNTYWWGNRTNFLYTAAELTSAGAVAGAINKIGFQISVVGGQAMTGLTFRFQNTTATTLSGFVSTGWTQGYTGTYTVPGTGWQYVDMTTPFQWNGTSNLLVEVCFGNTSYSTATTVLGTSMSGMEWTEYHDLSTACAYTGFSTGTAQTARANTCFVISPLTGVTPGNTGVPNVYELAQNYPNPFNPVTKINFAIPKQGLVSLKVYDVLGREVANLVNEVKTAGTYIVDFDATNLSSGVYFYKLEVNGFTDVKRMMLIK